MKRIIFIFMVVSLVAMFFLTHPSQAIMTGMSTEELSRGSDLVISGEVENIEARWSMDGEIIFTTVTIVNLDIVRGLTGQMILEVEYRGGEVDDIGYKVSDTPSFTKGEKVLIFLKSAQSLLGGDAFNVFGSAQGKYSVGSDGIAKKQGFSIANGNEMVDNNIPVDELIEKIRRVK